MAHTYPACPLPRSGGSLTPQPSVHRPGYIEGGHQLEKLEFALAIAISRGDSHRASELRTQIDALGELGEEPGT
ncbi:hypothetical protein KQ304_07450 [Synechococcus sp. CS-1329]|uniref:hypothetical protein n=1 Tax=Synechococcus sp. CS-1329 TaxID=2847975 RepID=UPI00223B4B4C|nr:hypothetical protein [Synechococcus sp. CS-1329]MCT0218835.1 hypothetical protein [Synechococcus sp. CS-1329]